MSGVQAWEIVGLRVKVEPTVGRKLFLDIVRVPRRAICINLDCHVEIVPGTGKSNWAIPWRRLARFDDLSSIWCKFIRGNKTFVITDCAQ